MNSLLSVDNLHVNVDQTSILKGLSLCINPGEFHAIMGPNGSGKSTFAYTLMGHPNYTITDGCMMFNGEVINDLSPDKRAKKGMFLAFQYPLEIEGVRFIDFLRQSYNARWGGTDRQLGMRAFQERVAQKMALLEINPDFVERSLNYGFSGGEKKRAEILQLAVLEPSLVILDEIDSGLDIDALRIVCAGINAIRASNPSISFVVITHYQRILNYLQPDHVHVMQEGRIVQSGDFQLAHMLEKQGYTQASQ